MRRKGVSYSKYGYFFCIPFVLAFLIFSLYPIIFTITIGFTDLKGLGKTDFKFQSDLFINFKTVLETSTFRKSFYNTLIMWIINFIPQILLALLLTAWFTNTRHKIKGQGFFKVIFYMPNIITAATIGILFRSLFSYPLGPINDIWQSLGFANEPTNFLLQKWTARGIVSFIQFWQWYGYTMIILISGVLAINPELFESAEIDGATGRQKFFFITLPNIRTIMIFTLITSLIGGLNMFDVPKVFQNGGPDKATLTTNCFIYDQAYSGSYMYNRAAAASMLLFIPIVILSAIIFMLMRDKYEAKQRKIEKKVSKERIKAEKAARRNA